MMNIVFANEKGGVGKTSAACNVGGELAARGHKVLIVDGDPQGHVASYFGHRKRAALYNLLVRPDEPEGDWSQVLERVDPAKHGGDGALYIIPNNVEGRNIYAGLSDVFLLDTLLRQLEVDYVLIDTSPTPNLFNGILMLTADMIVHPIHCEYASIDGLLGSQQRLKRANLDREGRGIAPLQNGGILPMRYRGRTIEHSSYLEELEAKFPGLVLAPLAESIAFAEAWGAHMTLPVYAPGHPAVKNLRQIVTRLEAVHVPA